MPVRKVHYLLFLLPAGLLGPVWVRGLDPEQLPAPRAVVPDKAPGEADAGPPSLASLWELALASNPSLREAEADIEAARGALIQAGKYPNPQFQYQETMIGARQGPPGEIQIQLMQPIVTAGKRRLNMAIAGRDLDAATLALVGRRFEVLTRIRRAYYEYLGWQQVVQAYGDVTASLQQAVDIVRKQGRAGMVSEAGVLRLEALLEEMKIGQAQSVVNRGAWWRQLVAEIGVPELPAPCPPAAVVVPLPRWDGEAVRQRVLAVNAELLQAGVIVDRARLAVTRARAEAVPDISVGGGYSRDYTENTYGGMITVQADLPTWDRKQGHIWERRAQLDRAEAARQAVATRLSRDVAEAFARYETARLQTERLAVEVVPRLEKSHELVRKAYQAGVKDLTFPDVIQSEQSLNTSRLQLAQTRRDLWRALADLQGLMQLDVGEELGMGWCPP
jgi:cobalt-zinc-cadmium efflux system outer membrane protein